MDCDSERIWKTIEKYSLRDKAQRRPDSLNLFDNLYNCYIDNCQSCQDKRFRTGVGLLQKLPPNFARVSMVISLYSDEEGYSLMIGSDDQNEVFLPYEDNEIFSYLDAREIPPVVIEVLENTNCCQFYNGCLVCELRNYRSPAQKQSTDDDVLYESMLLLLKSSESALQYVNKVCSDRPCLMEERLAVESKLLLATQPPLCLEPEIDVVCVQNRLHYNPRKFHSTSFRRYIRRHSHAKKAIIYQSSEGKGPSSLQLHHFLTTQREKRDSASKYIQAVNIKRRKGISKLPCSITELVEEVSKLSKSYQSDVHSFLHQRTNNNEVSATTQNKPPVSIASETPPTNGKSSTDEVPVGIQPKKTISPDQSKPVTTALPPVVPKGHISGGLFVSLPRISLAQTVPATSTITKRVPEQTQTVPATSTITKRVPEQTQTVPATSTITKRVPEQTQTVPAASTITKRVPEQTQTVPQQKIKPPAMSLQRHGMPGKTTITVLSSFIGGIRPPNLHVPPKLRNPKIALKAINSSSSQAGAMPRLKPLEAHKLPLAPMAAMNKPPPLAAPPFITPTVPKLTQSIKTNPSSTPSMPQLHKIDKTS